jgi:subtilase family serine protease
MKKRSVAVSMIALGAFLSSASVAGATMRAGVRPASSVNVRRACEPVRYGARCGALVRTDVRGRYATVLGYGPTDLQSAYLLPTLFDGLGQTIAVVDAFDDPTAESDLAAYRSYYALPPCTSASGCFKKLNESGVQGNYPPPNQGWALEISLDVDVASAACPNCHITVVEANTNAFADLATSVDTAVASGANVVNNGYFGCASGPSCGDAYGSHYNHPGVMMTAAAGDEGYGVGFPMDQGTVVAVGGTHLRRASNARGWSEVVWSGTGSGCTTQPKPSWQAHPGCSHRIVNDVAADADPATGVALYDSGYGGWLEVGGTDVATAIVSGAYALAANEATQTYASGLYATNAPLYDIRVGANGTCAPQFLCVGEVGYDGPTGDGTPKGIGAF